MSHITTIEMQIKDLDALDAACKVCGVELVKQKEFRYYAGKMEPCEWAIRVKDAQPNAWGELPYEMGLTLDPSTGAYRVLFDPFAGGRGLMERVAHPEDLKTPGRLMQEYSTTVAKRQLIRQGYRVREVRKGSKVTLRASR